MLLTQTARVSGLGSASSAALQEWRKPLTRHDPAKVVADLAICVALDGDACSDIALIRAEPGVYGPVASDATISRTIAALVGDIAAVAGAVAAGRRTAGGHVWSLAGPAAPNHGIDAANPLVIDLDATLVRAHSDKEKAAPTFKRGYGFRPREREAPPSLCAFVDHGSQGTGEPLAMLVRPGNAGSNTAAGGGQRRGQLIPSLRGALGWRVVEAVGDRGEHGRQWGPGPRPAPRRRRRRCARR